MSNDGQPTISEGATGDAVRWLQRALRRTPNWQFVVDGVFGPITRAAVIEFQEGSPPLAVDGIVGPQTWAKLPDGAPMPLLQQGSTGVVVSSLQTVLTGFAEQYGKAGPQGVDGIFGPKTKASVEALQQWRKVIVDGIVGDQTWGVQMGAAGATLESLVGFQYLVE